MRIKYWFSSLKWKLKSEIGYVAKVTCLWRHQMTCAYQTNDADTVDTNMDVKKTKPMYKIFNNVIALIKHIFL